MAPADGLIVEGPGNRGGDPLFADPTRGDYHLLARSPAIDAGVAQAEADPSDLDGHARAQGMAVDLGAFEATPSLSAGSGGPHGVITRRAVLSRLRVSPSRFHTGGRAKISFRLDNASSVRLSFQRVLHGHRKGRRCVSGGNGHGSRCTVLRSAGRLAVPHGQAGTNTVLFLGRLAGKALIPGSYRLTATPAQRKGDGRPDHDPRVIGPRTNYPWWTGPDRSHTAWHDSKPADNRRGRVLARRAHRLGPARRVLLPGRPA